MATYRIIPPIATVLGDNLSSNKLCAKMDNKTSPVRMSRMCLTPFQQADSIPHKCHHICETIIEKLSMAALGCCYGQEKASRPEMYDMSSPPAIRPNSIPPSNNLDQWWAFLNKKTQKTERDFLIGLREKREKIADEILWKVLGSHSVDNAFNGMDFGSNGHGRINRATVADILHSVEEGLVHYVIALLFDQLTGTEKEKIDEFVESMFTKCGRNRSGERTNYPRVDFTRGFCSLSFLSADERIGQLFVIAIMLQVERGKDLLRCRFAEDFDTVAAQRAMKKKRKRGEEPPHVEAATLHEDEEEEPQQRGEAEGQTAQTQLLSNNEIKQFLSKVHLGYVSTDLLPHLCRGHQDILWDVCKRVIRNTAETRKVLANPHSYFDDPGGQFQGDKMMDYRHVPLTRHSRTDFHPPPAATNTASADHHIPVTPSRQACSIRLGMDQFSILVQKLLCFHSFLKYGGHRLGDPTVVDRYIRSFNLMMNMVVRGLNRGKNTNGFKLQKFIECCHFLQDTITYGPPAGNNSDTGERGLKTWAKRLAITAQKRGDAIFKGQVAKNAVERAILEKIDSSLRHRTTTMRREDTRQGLHTRGLTFVYQSWRDGRRGICPVVGTTICSSTHVPYPSCVEQWFDKHVILDSNPIQFSTEIIIKESDGGRTIVRAHPNFRSEGEWFDYIFICYENPQTQAEEEFPARVACCFKWDSSCFNATERWIPDGLEDGDCVLLVQECEYQSPAQASCTSLLFDEWTLCGSVDASGTRRYAKLSCMAAEAIQSRVYAIDPNPMNGGAFWKEVSLDDSGRFDILLVKGRKDEWVENFLK